MTEITFEELRGLIAAQEVRGSRVEVTFKCPTTGASHESSAGIRKGKGLGNVALSAAKQGMWRSLRSGIMRAISGALGSGAMASVGRQVSNQMVRDASQGSQFTGEDVEAAVVEAFQSVQSKFRREGQGWVAAHGEVSADVADTGFQAQLRQGPVSERYDQGVLARVLVEVARGDGKLSSEEEALLGTFVDPSMGTIAELATRPPLSSVELSETSAAARDTILMLGWALALSDQSLAPSEQARLAEVASGFEISAEQAAVLQGYAQAFLVDQALEAAYASGSRDPAAHQEAMAVAAAIGLSAEAAELADVRFRKAKGIV
ncbi:MAG: TerB family tellurite resistance protein [Planctomycetes bacterium]|nr:TerB family tellurite resistance protein [Planctomycetota bacterium]